MGRTPEVTLRPNFELRTFILTIVAERPASRRHKSSLTCVYHRLQVDRRHSASWPQYEVHGRILSSGACYENRLISVVTIENRKIIHWRDYMDSLAAWTALNSASH